MTTHYNRDMHVHPHLRFTDVLKEACFIQMTKTHQHYNVLLHAQNELKLERQIRKNATNDEALVLANEKCEKLEGKVK